MDVNAEYKLIHGGQASNETYAILVLAKAVVWAAQHIVTSLDWNGERSRAQ